MDSWDDKELAAWSAYSILLQQHFVTENCDHTLSTWTAEMIRSCTYQVHCSARILRISDKILKNGMEEWRMQRLLRKTFIFFGNKMDR